MIDTHTHIYEQTFDADRPEVIARAQEAGVTRMILPSCTPSDMRTVATVCAQFPTSCFPLYGLHPTEMGPNPMAEAEEIMDFAEKQDVFIGVGEIGLDLHWDKTRQKEQEEVFLWQMRYAYNHNKPASIHVRDAVYLLLQLLEKLGPEVPQGSLHCFSGSQEEAKVIARKYPQLMFGFGGSSTYKNSRTAQVATVIPQDRILTETDAPYLTPVPHRGQRNEPAFVPLVVEKLATTLNLTPQEVDNITTANAQRLFFNQQ